jgi:hypothetical protein
LALRGDKPVDVVAVIALKICVLTPEKAALSRTVQAQIYCSEGSDRASLAVHLVNETPKEHFDFRETNHLGKVGQHRPLVIPITLSAAFPGETADSSPISLWSELG